MTTDTIAPWAEPALITAEQLLALPEDAWHYELIEGRLVRMPPTGYAHGRLEGRLAFALQRFVEPAGLGEVIVGDAGFLLSAAEEPDTLLAPDIAFVSAARAPSSDSPSMSGFPRL